MSLVRMDEVEETVPTVMAHFGHVLEGLKEGRRAKRMGWNSADQFIFLVPGSSFVVSRPPLLGIFEEGTQVEYHAHIDMKTSKGYIVPWLASQSDILADDWEIFE